MKHWHRLLIGVLVALALVVTLALIAPTGQGLRAADGIIYVDADATVGNNDGTSWADAFTDLQDALAAAEADDEIWVAEGTYTPTSGDDRTISFQMKNGVAIYGGFAGIETSLAERDWDVHETTLSGDLNGDDGPDFANNDENSYHVFYHPLGTDLDTTAILDGFTISDGNADGDFPHIHGAGMYNSSASPTLTNCTFERNATIAGGGFGGGMYNDASSPVLINCAFEANSGHFGGGVHNNASSPVLTNCSFADNSAYYGGGIYNEYSSPALTNCSLSGNSAGRGGGIYNDHSSPTLTSCSLSGNLADAHGGGIYDVYNSSPMLTHCTFTGNSAGGSGAGIYNNGSSPVLTNCTFFGNSATHGGGMLNTGSSPTLTNCTFSGNSADDYYGGAMYNGNDSSPVVTNCILWGDTSEIDNFSSTPVVTYSDIQGGYPGESNIYTDPLFVDPDSSDYHLAPGSPCIDAGSNVALNLPHYDFEGDPRIVDGDGDGTPVVDMGVDELYDGSPPPVVFVDSEAAGTNNGTSWVDAYTTLQPALEAAEPGEQIWVAAGIYTPTQESYRGDPRSATFQMKNRVAIYGGFDPSVSATEFGDRDWVTRETILSGDLNGDDGPGFVNRDDNSYVVFYHPAGTNLDGTAILDGFTITGGNSAGGGAGMANNGSSPTLTNCTFSGNSAPTGGAMYNVYSSPVLINCAFADNAAHRGGGMCNSGSSPTLTNCTFSGNLAEYDGGAMWNYESSPTLTNCTFSGNHAYMGGGAIYNGYSSPVVTNSILWGNSSPQISGDYSTPVVTYSDIQDGYSGMGNIDADPFFVDPDNDDYHLRPDSLCIDVGSNAALSLPPHDFEGHPRIMDGDRDGTPIVDMGIDEVFGYAVHLPVVLRAY